MALVKSICTKYSPKYHCNRFTFTYHHHAFIHSNNSNISHKQKYNRLYQYHIRHRSITAPRTAPVFDKKIHNLHKSTAASLPNSHEYDYFRHEIATRLISRILDIDRSHPIGLDLGCHSGQFYKELINFIRSNPTDKVPGGIKELYQFESSSDMLYRDIIPSWQNELIPTHRILWDNTSDEDEYKLPFETNQFDIVISGMSLQWINNIPLLFTEIFRILKPDGAFIGAFSGGASLQELRSSLLLADQERIGGMNSHMSPVINISDIGSLLGNAGFVLVTIDNELIEIPYPNMFVLMEHLHGSGDTHAPYKNVNDSSSPYVGISKDLFIAAASAYDAMYSNSETIEIEKRNELNECLSKVKGNDDDDDGSDNDVDDLSIDASMQIIYFMCWTPHPSQRAPMEKGTQQFSFKDLEEISDVIEETEQQIERKEKEKDVDVDKNNSDNQSNSNK